VNRYHKARNGYLTVRIGELFLQHMETIDYGDDSSKPSFQYPPIVSESEKQELQTTVSKTRTELFQTVKHVTDSYTNVYEKYNVLLQKRKDLECIVDTVEQQLQPSNDTTTTSNNNNSDNDKENDSTIVVNDENDEEEEEDDDDDENDEVWNVQEETFKSILMRKTELETKLRKIRMETREVTSEIDQNRALYQSMLKQRGGEREASNNNLEDDAEELRNRARDYANMAEMYESTRTVIEELGGIKIISVTAATPPTPTLPQSTTKPLQETKKINSNTMMISPTKSPRKKSPRMGRSANSPPQLKPPSPPKQMTLSSTNQTTKDDKQNNDVTLKILLLDQYILNLTLKSIPVFTNTGTTTTTKLEQFRVSAAQFETTTTTTTPPLDDLVELSLNLDPIQDLKFVIRETISRLRTTTAKNFELMQLRSKYLTKITPATTAAAADARNNNNKRQYGGSTSTTTKRVEDQEVVCSLNDGITVVLRLTTDCPVLDGSARIHQIVGVGGWDEGCLSRIKTKVNGTGRRGPVEIMDALVEEISRLEREEGVVIPRTPVLPMRKNNISDEVEVGMEEEEV